MSYDVRLEIDTGGPRPAYVTEERNPTYNIGPMLREALGIAMQDDREGTPCLDGMLASEALPLIERALHRMHTEQSKFRAMNPPNGWGSYDTAIDFLQWLAEECHRHPKATVRT